MSSNQEVDSNKVNSDEVKDPKFTINYAISDSTCKTVDFVWNIENFRLLAENSKFRSSYLEIYPNCCYAKFEIQRELTQKESGLEKNSWTFTILTDVMWVKNLPQGCSFEGHLRKEHNVDSHICNQYLMGSSGNKMFLEKGSISNRKFVIQLSDEQLRDGSEYSNSGSLEFRTDLQLIKILNRAYVKTIPNSLILSDNLGENFSRLLKNQVLCDLTIKTDDGSFKAHKAIMAARSPVFEKMFTIDMKEKKQNSVTIHEADSETMRIFLRYIYEGKLEFVDSAELDQKFTVLHLADQYQIPRLKRLCELELIRGISANSIFKILVEADTYNAKIIRRSGLDFVRIHKSTLAKHEDIGSAIKKSKELRDDILGALSS